MILTGAALYFRDRNPRQCVGKPISATKETTMEVAQEQIPNVPPPEAIVTVHLAAMRRSQEEAASSNGEMRSTYSRAEAKGINLPAAKRALKIQKSGKAEEFVAEMTELLRYLKILGIGVQKSQLDLFETAPSLAPLDEKAYEDGLRAGRAGDAADNPHAASTEAGQRWEAGYAQGAIERRLVLEMEAAEDENGAKVIPADEVDPDQTDIEDDEPFGEEWPDDKQIAAHAAE